MTTLTIPCEVTIQAAAGDEPRKFTSNAYSGGAIRLRNFPLPVVVDLQGLAADDTVVVNLDHQPERRVGHVTDVANDGRKLTLSGIVSAASAAAAEFVESALRKFPWSGSIEARPERMEDIAKGQTVTVNGQQFAGPITVVRRAVLYGLGIVSKGADTGARVALASQRVSKMNEFVSWCTQMGFDLKELDADEAANMHANYCGRETITAADREAVAPLITATADDPVATERRRINKIEQACSGDNWGDQQSRVDDIKARAIAGSISYRDMQLELLECLRANRPHLPPSSASRRDVQSKVIEASFCLQTGLPDPERHYPEQVLDAADKMRGYSLQQLLLQAAMNNGYHCRPGERISQGNLRAVLEHAFYKDIRAAGFSTLSIPTILSNVANKAVEAGFRAVDTTCLRISAIRPVSDFKEVTSFSLTGDLEYEKLGPAGQIKHGEAGERTYTNRAETYARMLAITRQDVINDDVGALVVVPQRLGRGGALKLNEVFWTLFLDNSSIFSVGNANVSTGGGSALDTAGAGLAAADKVFMNQTDPDGKPLGLMSAILLVPPTLKRTAMALMNSALVVGDADRPAGNVWRATHRVESSPYMENSSYTGNSAAAWYLLAEPSALAVVELVFLNGRTMPVVETMEADFDVLGIQSRGYHDFGCAFHEYRAGVRSAGS